MIIEHTIEATKGRVDRTNQAEIENMLVQLVNETDYQEILLDFQNIEFIDATGLIALVNVYKQAKNRNKNVYLFNVLPKVKIMFEISQLDQILGIRDLSYDSNNNTLKLVA